jgi:hypothetical protein
MILTSTRCGMALDPMRQVHTLLGVYVIPILGTCGRLPAIRSEREHGHYQAS